MKFKGFILSGLLIILTGILKAQTDFRPGYVIKSAGDTIFGRIDYRGDLLMSSLCKFKAADNTIKEYSPNDIEAFRFIESKFYVTKEINNKKVFMEYLIKGKVNIYYMRDEKGDHYYVDKEDARLSEIPYEQGIKSVDNVKLFYESTNHIGFLKYYMKDAPQFQSRIESVKKPEHQTLIKLAEDYHNSVCKGEKCIIYEKVQPLLKVNLEGLAGVVNFIDDDMNKESYFQGGVILNFWLPRINEKIYFKTGFLYSPAENNDWLEKRHVKIPLHIAYLAPKTYRIRPTLSFGLLSPSYSGGIFVRINQNANFGIQSWANFSIDKVPWFPTKLSSYSIFGSLYIEI